MEALWFGFRSASWGELSVVGGFELGRRDVAERAVEPCVVEPVDPAERRELDVVDGPPGCLAADQLCLEHPIYCLGQSIVIGISDGPNRRTSADVVESFGVSHTRELRPGVGVTDQPVE